MYVRTRYVIDIIPRDIAILNSTIYNALFWKFPGSVALHIIYNETEIVCNVMKPLFRRQMQNLVRPAKSHNLTSALGESFYFMTFRCTQPSKPPRGHVVQSVRLGRVTLYKTMV